MLVGAYVRQEDDARKSNAAKTSGDDGRDCVETSQVLGSGCVAQVHRGILPSGAEVAVKVVHPGVRELVECDMALLKIAGSALERVAPGLRYLAVRGSIARFEALMRAQLDLRTEAANLEKLHALFAKDEGIAVPRPSGVQCLRRPCRRVSGAAAAATRDRPRTGRGDPERGSVVRGDESRRRRGRGSVRGEESRRGRGRSSAGSRFERTDAGGVVRRAGFAAQVPRPSSDVGGRDGAQRDVLVEDFVAGVPVLEYFKTHQAEGKELARRGTEAVLKMVLHHNFVHGDLHPGNLLVDDTGRLIFLDAGICVEIPDKTHEVMVRVLRAMLENDGDAAARLLLATDRHAAEARDAGSDARETAFVKGFSDFVERTRHQPVFDSLSSYVGDVCRLAVSNRVALDASFVSMALAVKIMEGLVVDMDPTFPFVEVAMPFFMKAQCMRASKKELNKLSAYSRAMLDRLRAEESSTSSV